MERQSSSSTEFIILRQVEFLGLDDNPIFHSELLKILDMYEHSNSTDPINIINAEHHDDQDQDQDDANRYPHLANQDDDDDDINNNVAHDQLEEEDDDDDKGELVPWEVRNKFGGQRMRKLEERVIHSKKKAASKRSSAALSVRRKQGRHLNHSYRKSFIPNSFEE